MSPAEIELASLMLEDPAEYQRLLDGYFAMIGDQKLWWQRCTESTHKGWTSCIRGAITQCANKLGVSPLSLSGLLDLPDFTMARAHILKVAKERLGHGVHR